LILSGSGNKTAGGALTVNGDFTINGSSSFVGGTSLTHTFLGNWVVNTNAAAPFSYTTASTINFNTPGTPAATSLSGTTLSSIDLNNVTLNNTSGFSSSHDFSASGSVTVANGVTFAPSADIVVSGSGTLTGNGTVRVTRTSPSAEMNSQFTITTKTLTNLTVEYNGTAAQSISALTYGGLKINNANGVSLGGNVTVNGILTLQSGNISTSSNKVILGSSGSVSRTSGHVVGNLQKTVATGPSSLTYEVGDASNYSPVAVTFGNVATGGNLIAKVTATEHPNIASSTINPVRSVNRYWTLTNNGMVFDNYSATFNFVENDIDAGADANTFDVQHYNGSWSTATTGTRTSTSTQATGLTSFSDYAVGKPIVQYTINASAGSNGSITPSGNISVTEGASQSFTIAASTGYHIADVLVDGNSQGAISSYNFTNISDNHSISATFAIDQFTITVNAGANGSITPGTTTVNYGSNQSFSIAANVGYHIVDVLVDGNSQGAVASYNFANVTAAHTISATFAIDQFTITVNAGANGSITPGTTTVNYGSNQSFSIAANVGYHIVDVLVDGNSQGAVASYNFVNVTAAHTISATFAIDQFTITVNAGANGSITPGTTTVNYGSNQSFSIAANVGYHIVDVLVDGNSQGAVASYNFANVTASHTISATFAIDQFTITVNAGANGSITPGTTTVNYGSNQSFSIAANTGYHIVDVLIDAENSQGAVTSYDFTNVIANHTISATFAIDQFTITVSAGANGSITPGTTTVNYGSNQSFSIAANVGYHIVDVLVDGNSQGTAASYNFSNVTALHTISASFAIDTFTVTSSLIGSNGTISPLGSTTVNYGSSQFYTITPDTGYQVDSVIVDGSLVDSTTSYTFDNITANHTIAVNFKLLPIVDTVLYRTFKASTSDLGTTKAVKLKFKNGALTSGEPNMMTVLENTFARIGKTGTTFLGVPQTDKDSSKKYAWIFAKKAGDFAKYYSITHTGLGYPIDSFRQTGKKAKKLSKALKPDKKYNNQMWAEAMMLRLNILASQDSITPKGFGALVLDTAATLLGRNLEGQTLSSIASYLDSLMTYWERLGVNDTSLNITELSLFATDVIGRINNGFSTVMNASNYIIDTNGVTKGDSTLVGKKKNSYAVTLLGYVPAESVDIVRRVPGKTVEPFIPVVGFREVPGEYVLEQNFPNPFNPTTSIVFSLPEETEVTLKVYSILGQEIATLISNKYLDAGEHEITFDASNLSSGVYFYRMNFGDGTYSTMKKMLLLK
jgi:hypothetical protein